MVKVEIRISIERYSSTREKIKKEFIECINRLGESFFPLLIITPNKREKQYSLDKSCGWTGTFREFVEFMELRETFGKEPDKDKMVEAFKALIKKHDEAKGSPAVSISSGAA